MGSSVAWQIAAGTRPSPRYMPPEYDMTSARLTIQRWAVGRRQNRFAYSHPGKRPPTCLGTRPPRAGAILRDAGFGTSALPGHEDEHYEPAQAGGLSSALARAPACPAKAFSLVVHHPA